MPSTADAPGMSRAYQNFANALRNILSAAASNGDLSDTVRNLMNRAQGMLDTLSPTNAISVLVQTAQTATQNTGSDDNILASLTQALSAMTINSATEHGYSQAVILRHLGLLQSPQMQTVNPSDGEVQAWLLTADEAFQLMDSDAPITAPVFVLDDHSPPWLGTEDTISQLLDWYQLGSEEVFVASPYADSARKSITYFKVSIDEIRQHFAPKQHRNFPWKIVGLPNPMPHSLLPSFLNGPNSSLLHDMKRVLMEIDHSTDINHSQRRPAVFTARDLDVWKEIEGSFELTEGGALSRPQQSQYGFGTWITCIEGELGLAWLHDPTEDLVEQWREDPDRLTNSDQAKWLFKVLRERQTAYLPPGAIYFIFRRHHGRQSLAATGHVLRRTDAQAWLETLDKIVDAAQEDETTVELRKYVPQFLQAFEQLVSGVEGTPKAERYGKNIDWMLLTLKTKIETKISNLPPDYHLPPIFEHPPVRNAEKPKKTVTRPAKGPAATGGRTGGGTRTHDQTDGAQGERLRQTEIELPVKKRGSTHGNSPTHSKLQRK